MCKNTPAPSQPPNHWRWASASTVFPIPRNPPPNFSSLFVTAMSTNGSISIYISWREDAWILYHLIWFILCSDLVFAPITHRRLRVNQTISFFTRSWSEVAHIDQMRGTWIELIDSRGAIKLKIALPSVKIIRRPLTTNCWPQWYCMYLYSGFPANCKIIDYWKKWLACHKM